MMHYSRNFQDLKRLGMLGFSLVELSIVLVILGLLVGGILSGQSLIHASELRAMTTQHDKYLAGALTFRDKYFALPGDMTNATQFWGQMAVGAACYSTPSPDARTCDGDGDGRILNSETVRFWQQLANAALIEGTYNGFSDWPATKSGGQWRVAGIGDSVGDPYFFDGSYGNTIYGGGNMIAEDIWNIDRKIDDGKPATGAIVAATTVTLDKCTNVSAAASQAAKAATMTADYLLTSQEKACGVGYRNQF